MSYETVELIQASMYVFMGIGMVGMLYGYIWHLYSNKENKDYEKYSDLALNDDIESRPLEPRN